MNDDAIKEFRAFRSEQLANMRDSLSFELLDLADDNTSDAVFFKLDHALCGADVFKLNGFTGVKLTVYNVRPKLYVNGRQFVGFKLFRMMDAIMQADFDCAADKKCAELDIQSPVIWMARA